MHSGMTSALAASQAVTTQLFSEIADNCEWAALMRKRTVPEIQRGVAPLTIGLGPNFVASENVDVAIETCGVTDLARSSRPGATEAARVAVTVPGRALEASASFAITNVSRISVTG